MLSVEIFGEGLILPGRSGVTFTNQCGGGECAHPQHQEGVFVPLALPSDELCEILHDYWEDRWRSHPKRTAISDAVDELLHSRWLVDTDRGRLCIDGLCWGEAWWPVVVREDCGAISSMDHPLEAILTWENSD